MAAPQQAEERLDAARLRARFPETPEPGPSTFFARQTYLRRRLMDAARMMPAFGAALFLLPTIWVSVDKPADTSAGFVYLFAVWVVLIFLGRIIARRIMAPLPDPPDPAQRLLMRRDDRRDDPDGLDR